MRCSKARDYLSRDLDGLLPPDATAGLREHVDACDACSAFREDLVLGRRLLAATEPHLPDNFDWKLQLRLNQALQQRAGETAYPWQEGSMPRRGSWLPAFGAASSVGLAAVLAVAVLFGPQSGPVMVAAPTGSPGGAATAVAARAVPEVAGPAAALPIAAEPVVAGSSLSSSSGSASVAGRSDRRTIFSSRPGAGLYGSGMNRSVAFEGGAQPVAAFDRGWSGDGLRDLQTITQLRTRNTELQLRLIQSQIELRKLKAQLDTTGGHGLDTVDSH